MDLFQNTLKEALDKNQIEFQKWKKYEEELIQTEQNIKDFQKKLQIECMVPIGKKALMPGYLYHTSEILIGHGNKTFSKCTGQEALKVCRHRRKYAEDRLQALSKERNLHQNKLELPFMENAFESEGQEIIEEYDEEKERKWREEHQKRVAAYKKQEAAERNKINESTEKTHEEIMDLLDELELMDELEQELNDMEVSTDEQLQKIMSGEIKVPSGKKRISHYDKPKDIVLNGTMSSEAELEPKQANKIKEEPKKIEVLDQKLHKTEENNEDEQIEYSAESESESDIDNTISEQVYLQFSKILQETKHFTRKEKLQHLKSKLKEVQVCLRELIVQDVDTLTTKIDLSDLKECIEDELIRMQTNPNCNQDTEVPDAPEIKPKKSRIKFATEDDVKLIDKFEAPCQVSMPDIRSKQNLVLEIKFKHSDSLPAPTTSEEAEEQRIVSPVDIYRKFEHCMKKSSSFEQVTKSILKNKEKVLNEIRLPNASELVKNQETPRKKVVKKISTPINLLGEVVERPVSYGTEAQSSEGKKKETTELKVSKFKGSRSNK